MHSTQFHRDPDGVAAPDPLIPATPAKRSHEELLRDYEVREAARQALEIHLHSYLERTCAAALIANCRQMAEKLLAEPDCRQSDMYPYFAGCLQAVLVDVCERLNEAQQRPGDYRARVAYQRRVDREAKKRERGAL